MLARNNSSISVFPGQETELIRWVADGIRYLIGFNASGSYSARFALYIEGLPEDWINNNLPGQGVYNPSDPWYTQRISPSNRNAYVADRGVKLPAGTVTILKIVHYAPTEQFFEGSILGG